ncbi:MAG: tetratricopeptide repeat protein [Promethearchaeota archaeon]
MRKKELENHVFNRKKKHLWGYFLAFSDIFSSIKRKLQHNQLISSLDQLNLLENLLYQGKSHELLDSFEKLKKIGEITRVAPIDTQILEILILYELDEFQSGLNLTEQVITLAKQSEDRLSEFYGILLKIKANLELGDSKTCLTLIENAEEFLHLLEKSSVDVLRLESDLNYLKARFFLRTAEYNTMLDLAQKLLIVRRENRDQYELAECLNLRGIAYSAKGEYQSANDSFQESLSIFGKFNNKKATSKILNNLGMNSWRLSNLLKALTFFQKSLVLAEEMENLTHIAITHLNIGLIYVNQGELNLALESFQKSMIISKEIGQKRPLSSCLTNMGLIYHARGDFEQAMRYYQESLVLSQELGNKHDIALCYNNIGEIYHSMGKIEEAFDHIKKSLTFFREIGATPDMTLPLFNLVETSISSGLPQKAQSYLQQLQEINMKEENNLISQRYRLAEALVLKSSRRVKMRIQSSDILEKLISEENVDHGLTIRAMFELSELLIDELRAYGEEEVFYKVKELIQRLDKIANRQNSYSLIIDTAILQARLSMVEGDLNASQKYLDRVELIAKEKEIHHLAKEIQKEKEQLKSQYKKWESLIQSNAPFRSRLEQAQLAEYIYAAKKTKREWGSF